MSTPKLVPLPTNRPPVFLKDSQVAERLGVHRTTVWRLARTPDFPSSYKLAPGITRWLESEVIEAQEQMIERAKAEAEG